MTLLEERYRAVLRLLPSSYRAEWEEEMVATFMDAVGDLSDADVARPSWSEVASVAALAVRVRLGGAGAAPRSLVCGEAVRLTALLGLLVLASLSCLNLAGSVRLYVFGPPPGLGIDYSQLLGRAGSVERLRNAVAAAGSVAMIAAYLTLLRGHRGAAKVLAVLALGSDLAPVLLAPALLPPTHFHPETLAFRLPAAATVLALLAGYHRDAPRAPYAWWLVALPFGASAFLATSFAVLAIAATQALVLLQSTWTYAGGLYSLLLLGAGLAYVGVHAYAPARRTASWPLSLALLAVPVLGARLAVLRLHLSANMISNQAAMVIGQVVAILLVGLILLVLGTRLLRQLPNGRPHRVRPLR